MHVSIAKIFILSLKEWGIVWQMYIWMKNGEITVGNDTNEAVLKMLGKKQSSGTWWGQTKCTEDMFVYSH